MISNEKVKTFLWLPINWLACRAVVPGCLWDLKVGGLRDYRLGARVTRCANSLPKAEKNALISFMSLFAIVENKKLVILNPSRQRRERISYTQGKGDSSLRSEWQIRSFFAA